ncbi:PucR family transcriptional regulator [Amycolatopsis sp. NPDC059021]|uniref:PucR family transcriptional regulator n=1 Tax=Amycolatopsis sp. NPDC059021 TaxID=3346704 RepID=UPI00366DE910
MSNGAHEPSATLLRSLSRSSLGRAPSLADTLVDLVWEDVYAPRGPVRKDDLWRSCDANISSMLRAVGGSGPAASVLLETARATGARRAGQRCPFEWVRHAWRVGGQVIWDDFAAQAGTADADELRRLVESATTVWRVVDEFTTEMAEAYRAVEQEMYAVPDQRTLELLDALLDGTITEPTAEMTRLLGLPPDGGFVVVVTEVLGQAALHGALRSARAAGSHGVWRRRPGLSIGIMTTAGGEARELATMLAPSLSGRTGLSPVLGTLTEVAEGRRLAELAMATIPPGTTGIVALDDCLPDALVLGSPRLARRLIDVTFGPLLELPGAERGELLDTATAWVRSAGSAVQAARTLYCHRNTVLNRLNRIRALTGVDLTDTASWSQVTLALSALRYRESAHVLKAP